MLGYIDYNDKYRIAKFFSEDFGSISVLWPYTRGRSRKSTAMPISFSEVSLYLSQISNSDLYYIDEVAILKARHNISMDTIKLDISMFIGEILRNILRNIIHKDIALYQYIKYSFDILENINTSKANFHIVFLIGLSRYLGIYPNIYGEDDELYFSIEEACMLKNQIGLCLSIEESSIFKKIVKINYRNMNLFRFSRNERNQVLDHIISYYRYHMPEIGTIKSLDYLRQNYSRS